jgi:hypothetical protein
MKTRPARLLLAGAWPFIVLALTTGCTSEDAADSQASTTLAQLDSAAPPTPPTSPSTPTSASDTPAAATTVQLAVPDGEALLQQGFAELADGYHFVTTATVQGAVALSAEGDHIGDRTRLDVTSNGATLGYIVTPEGSWASQNGTWQELDEIAPVTDPISPLASPTEVTVTSYGAAAATLSATYPAEALALPGDAMVTVVFEILGTSIQSMTYAPADDATTSVRADISPLADASPISVPSVDS